ncbi:hypothetical protein [uncultured Abyssibacter sp.]|uniref:hypothetical protein n=1 Tax=uncultured Abyssibacter sp. TaxID=2320202 RepID=UPI0032B2D554
MKHRHAHWWLLALLPITVIAFWPSYFGRMPDAPPVHHLHGVTSTAWILLMAWQAWLFRQKNIALHRVTGRAMFVVVPLMVAGFAWVSLFGAVRASTGRLFYVEFGTALLTLDVLLTFTTPWLVYLALRYRQRMELHSALMIGTLMPLLNPVTARLLSNYVPGLQITGPDTLANFGTNLALASAVSTALPLALYLRQRSNRWPWLLSAAISAVGYVAYLTLGQTTLWTSWVLTAAQIPTPVVLTAGAALGAVACWTGMRHSTRSTPRMASA